MEYTSLLTWTSWREELGYKTFSWWELISTGPYHAGGSVPVLDSLFFSPLHVVPLGMDLLLPLLMISPCRPDWINQLWYCLHNHRGEESVVQSKRTHSQKPKLSTIECGHQMDGWLLCAQLCAWPEIPLESNSMQSLQKSFGWGYKLSPPPPPPPPHMCIHMHKNHIRWRSCQSSADNGNNRITQHALKWQWWPALWPMVINRRRNESLV